MKKIILLFAIISVLISAVPSFCAPAEPPPEVAAGATQEEAQTWSEDKTTQNWPTALLASGYNLYRGTLAELPNLVNGNSDSCARYTGTTTSADLADDDPSTVDGMFFWYIVTGYNSYGEGPAGDATTCSRILDPGSNCGSSYCGDGDCDGNEGTWCPDCPPVCYDGICDPSEECTGCPDCPPCCGDFICDPSEECTGCSDCPPCCGDAICDPSEECTGCSDCPPCCGDAFCDPSEECTGCSDCPPCCGDAICDWSEECTGCADCPPCCGDFICDPGEEGNCSDCGPYCGDGNCDAGEEGWCGDCP